MRPVLPGRDLHALLVVELDDGAARRLARPCRARRACPPASRSRPRRPRSSRRGCRGCRRTRPSTRWRGRRAAPSRWRRRPSATTCRTSRAPPRGSSMMRCIITGTTTSESARLRATSARHCLGVELAAQHVGRAEDQPEREVREAPGVEQRRGDVAGLARLAAGCARAARHAGSSDCGLPARRALRRAGRAAREDHRAPLARRAARRRVGSPSAISSSSVGSSVLLGVVPGDEALAPLARLGEQAGELLVVDDRRRASRARRPRRAAARRRRCSGRASRRRASTPRTSPR